MREKKLGGGDQIRSLSMSICIIIMQLFHANAVKQPLLEGSNFSCSDVKVPCKMFKLIYFSMLEEIFLKKNFRPFQRNFLYSSATFCISRLSQLVCCAPVRLLSQFVLIFGIIFHTPSAGADVCTSLYSQKSHAQHGA